MAAGLQELQMPPMRRTEEGAERRVGIELEMSGLSLDELTRVVARQLGLDASKKGRYERVLSGDPAGDWVIELDFDLLKKMGREERDPEDFISDLEEAAESLLHWGAEQLVPVEVVSPPLPLSRLGEVEGLIVRLREKGALGTAGNMLYAFGMQFNPEVPSLKAEAIRDYLKAFLCLYDWLHKRAKVNLTRRLTTYVDPFPADYVRQVVDPDYSPTLERLIDDYLADNPTRNRALDMLPLFSHLDDKRVRRQAADPLIKARPTFHYRLPNCEIEKPGWGLYEAWNDWVEVERLAEDKTRLQGCCAAYSKHLDQTLHFSAQWIKTLEQQWLK
ncbi:amidoligase family protein [Marinimicrobium alkaliphilum]|uniref:amidoligase family protein n=1 Tax=Marinimicrobium alkaliphilum TaxID=2202654 RepID=UPI000DBA3782|nr:amidoligase family protein [Marinimicrobium alkaliphilum]